MGRGEEEEFTFGRGTGFMEETVFVVGLEGCVGFKQLGLRDKGWERGHARPTANVSSGSEVRG